MRVAGEGFILVDQRHESASRLLGCVTVELLERRTADSSRTPMPGNVITDIVEIGGESGVGRVYTLLD